MSNIADDIADMAQLYEAYLESFIEEDEEEIIVMKGTVEAKTKGKTQRGTYGVLIGGKWYNSNYPIKADKGDEVEFEVGANNMLKSLTVIGQSKPQRSQLRERDLETQKHIIRQNALGHATALVTAGIKTPLKGADLREAAKTVTEIATILEAWVYTGGRVEQQETNEAPFDPE